jgi:hypothetical protein
MIRLGNNLWRQALHEFRLIVELLIGQPLATEDEKAERIGTAKGIPIWRPRRRG